MGLRRDGGVCGVAQLTGNARADRIAGSLYLDPKTLGLSEELPYAEHGFKAFVRCEDSCVAGWMASTDLRSQHSIANSHSPLPKFDIEAEQSG